MPAFLIHADIAIVLRRKDQTRSQSGDDEQLTSSRNCPRIGLRLTDPPINVHRTATLRSLQTRFPSHIRDTDSPRPCAAILVSQGSQRKRGVVTVRRDDGAGGGESDSWGGGGGRGVRHANATWPGPL